MKSVIALQLFFNCHCHWLLCKMSFNLAKLFNKILRVDFSIQVHEYNNQSSINLYKYHAVSHICSFCTTRLSQKDLIRP